MEQNDIGFEIVQEIYDLTNPSYLKLSAGGTELYVAHGDQSEVSAYRVELRTGRLSFLNRQCTLGRNPVHLEIDASGTFLLVSNYATGTLATLPIANDGQLKAVADLTPLPVEDGPQCRKPSSHPHQCLPLPGGEGFLVPDKGLDSIFIATLDINTGRLALDLFKHCTARQGAGPRHGAFHPSGSTLYLVNELDSSVMTCCYQADSQELVAVDIIPTRPPFYTGENSAAGIAIAPSGRFVYVSNRGHDSVAIYQADLQNHRLHCVGWTSCRGSTPRYITLDPSGRFLFCANEGSDSIIEFAIHPEHGSLTPTGRKITTGSPTCVVFSENT